MSIDHDLGDFKSARRRQVSPARVDRVVREVAQEWGVPESEIRGKRRGRMRVLARHEAWRRIAGPNVSIASIARAWPCHYTAVLHGLGRIKKDRKRYA
jgi:chromosomal replication initiation ATPase DnaA